MNQTDNPQAEQHCARGMQQFTRFRADATSHINAAIEVDPDYCLAKVVKAWMLHGASDARYCNDISALIKQCERLQPIANSLEANLLNALTLSHEGNSVRGATELHNLVKRNPHSLFLHTLTQDEIFWLGKPDWLLDVVEGAAPHWKVSDDDYGTFLSIRSFAHEEAGHYNTAERYGLAAVERDPSDVWGAHSVAHVLLMKGETQRGISWLESLSGNWDLANQMQHHMWWHLCLFLLETGEHDRVLNLLDTKIRDPESPLVKASPAATIDINNYASLLMRMSLYGVDVSQQWQTLSHICAERTTNHASAFSNVHDMMVLCATAQTQKANELLRSMTETFDHKNGAGALAQSYREVGIPVCQAIMAHYQRDYKNVLSVLGNIRHKLPMMGASHAQRDVFFHLLVHAAEQQQAVEQRNTFITDIQKLGFCDVPARAAYKNALH